MPLDFEQINAELSSRSLVKFWRPFFGQNTIRILPTFSNFTHATVPLAIIAKMHFLRNIVYKKRIFVYDHNV